MLNVNINEAGVSVDTNEPSDGVVMWMLILIFALLFGAIGGLVVLIAIGFWSSILGFFFSAIIGVPVGFFTAGASCKKRAKQRVVSSVRPPDAPGVHDEVPVSERDAPSGVAV